MDELKPKWVLVPVEPTEEMIEAYCRKHEALGFHRWVNASTVWPAMLASAPSPVVSEEMITRAVREHYGDGVDRDTAFRGAMRRALTAALGVGE